MKDWSTNPTSISIPRSKQKMKHSHKTTYNAGQLIPIYWREVLPGSTVKMNMAEVTRMQTPIFPIMDNAFIDTMFFFVPNRIIWEHWQEFMGENTTGYWEQQTEYEIPQIVFNSDQTVITSGVPSWIKGTKAYTHCAQANSLADYMGIPIVDANTTTPSARGEFEVNALPFRAYYQVYNDWWRDENLMLPFDYDKGDADVTVAWGGDQEESAPLTPPLQVAKFHDYFTSALPQPQKHDDVYLPLGNSAPVVGNGMALGLTDGTNDGGLGFHTSNYGFTSTSLYGKDVGTAVTAGTLVANNKAWGVTDDAEKSGLVADLSLAQGVTINQMRQLFAVQRFYEKQARGGSRYIEQLKSMFGVTSPDARLQRSEYLGGCRRPINIDQVVQTSETGSNTPQGNVAGYSLTTQNEELFTKSFVEHGILIGVQVVRIEHSYQDGLNKMWLRKSMFDYYNPTFANIGEQAILNKEIYLAGNVQGNKDDEAFGYQEAWAEYRYMNNHVSGEFRSKYHQSLDAWHFADDYAALPSLSYAWLEEYPEQINRNIAVSDNLADQFMSDIFFEETWTQPMPTYSVPGLIDHY